MSMLSAQRDRLRELADRFDGLAPENAALIRSAADTIWELRCKLNDEQDENEKLRNEFRKMDEWHSKELLAAVDNNAKLRELVRVFYHCTTSGVCDECPVNDGGTVKLMADTICDALHDRMRELGVEP